MILHHVECLLWLTYPFLRMAEQGSRQSLSLDVQPHCCCTSGSKMIHFQTKSTLLGFFFCYYNQKLIRELTVQKFGNDCQWWRNRCLEDKEAYCQGRVLFTAQCEAMKENVFIWLRKASILHPPKARSFHLWRKIWLWGCFGCVAFDDALWSPSSIIFHEEACRLSCSSCWMSSLGDENN